jgi:hypothetical protein
VANIHHSQLKLAQFSPAPLRGRGCQDMPMAYIYTGGAIERGGFSLGRVDLHLLGLKSCSTWCRSLRAPWVVA